MAHPEDIEVNDLVIPGKKGPFWIRKLAWDKLVPALFKNEETDDKMELMLRVALVALTNAQEKPVYTFKQMDKIKEDIAGGDLLVIAGTAYQLNKVDKVLAAFLNQETITKN